ncbi:putative nucleotidyltransferase substrate binding domain-containing protein [Nitratidesulfovibrio sp. 1201_IL3209]|uniref:putative nucleotidyltransferase substrate binding domain-containing protein n=1 Tax=Nitratidesulfovibrio sp. 1201_IL3209 TaxID=3084053 RepID=UPI002FD97508
MKTGYPAMASVAPPGGEGPLERGPERGKDQAARGPLSLSALPEETPLLRPVRDMIGGAHGPGGVDGAGLRAPLFVAGGTPLREAAARMAGAGASACLVHAPGGPAGPGSPPGVDAPLLPAGILTERDVVRALAEHGPGAAALPVEAAMTAALVTVREDELLFEGLSRMVRHAIRRLVVVAAGGVVRGMLEERDLLAAGADNPVQLVADMAAAPDGAACRPLLERARRVMARCVEQGVPARGVGRLGAELHDHLLARLAHLAVASMPLPPPAPFGMAVLGSQARRELFLAADQDAAMVISEASGDVPPEQVADYFERLAARLAALQAEAGVPDCPHGVVPRNPAWRMTLPAWRADLAAMLRAPDAQGVLRCSMLADARGVDDGWDLVVRLRALLTDMVRAAPLMLRCMAREATRFAPPLGVFGALVVERAGTDRTARATLDLKKGGLFPLMHGVRTLTLDTGATAHDTAGRIAQLRGAGVLSEARAADLGEAMEHLLGLRARAQAAAVRSGAAPDDRVRPDDLSGMERERLKQCFKVVADFQDMLRRRYSLHLMV